MILQVRYGYDRYDYVSSGTITQLIAKKQIMMFYRPSEKRWVDIERDPVRQPKDDIYLGEERRSLSNGP